MSRKAYVVANLEESTTEINLEIMKRVLLNHWEDMAANY